MAATAVATVVFSAAPAFVIGPATVTKSGTVLTLTAPPGTQHTIRIHEDATTITMRDLAGLRPAAGSGCTSVPTGTSDIVCSKTGLTRVDGQRGRLRRHHRDRRRCGLHSDLRGVRRGGATTRSHPTLRTASNTAARGNDVLANTSRQFPATLDGGTGTDRCARGTIRDDLVACEVTP